jgi:putative ABC transport system permease protein
MSLWSRIANVRRGDGLSREIDEELQSHIDEAIKQGRDPAEARRAFGSALQRREEGRDLRLVPWLDSLRADAVFGWRQIVKRKATSAAAILSLALAIGSCTSAFRLIDALLLRPLPVANPERLYVVAFESRGADGTTQVYDSCSYPMFRQMRAVARGQAQLIAVSYAERSDLTYGSDLEMEKAYRQFVSGWMFGAFGLRPAAGRLLTENDDDKAGASPYAVLSYEYWTRRFGQDRSVIGRTFQMGDTHFEIAGVAPESFTGTETGTVTDIFLPMAMKNPRTLASSNNFWLRTLVQLKPGVSAEPVHQMLSATYRAAEEERAKSFSAIDRRRDQARQEKFLLEPAGSGRSNLQRYYRNALPLSESWWHWCC